jgi:hypothetical protein
METSLSTAVCMAEMLSWEELTSEQRGIGGLGGMYGGYLAVGTFCFCFTAEEGVDDKDRAS